MRKFIEAVINLTNNGNGTTRKKPKGERRGPKSGYYWHKGAELIKIDMNVNRIVNAAGQAVLLDPELYDFTSDELLKTLSKYGTDLYSAYDSYKRFLNGDFGSENFNHNNQAMLWKASNIIFQIMLERGWSYIIYNPPELAHFVLLEKYSKISLQSASELLPLLQIDVIKITLMTNFNTFFITNPTISNNITLTFSKDEIQGFAGNFGAALDWTAGKDAPSSNYLYMLIHEHFIEYLERNPLYSKKINVNTKDGYKKRWALRFFDKMPNIPENMILIRIPVSVKDDLYFGHDYTKCGLTNPNTKGFRFLYSDKAFAIQSNKIEIFKENKWVKI